MFPKRLLPLTLLAALVLFADSASVAQNFWEQVGGPFGNNIIGVVAAMNGSVIVATGDGSILRTVDGSAPWIASNVDTIVRNMGRFTALGSNSSGMIVVTTEGAEYPYNGTLSLDNGKTWRLAGQPEQGGGGGINSIVVAPDGQIFETANGGVVASTDTGLTWNNLTGDLTDSLPRVYNANSVVITSQRHLFVGTDQGVYRSTNNGTHWQSCGVPHWVSTVALAPNGHLFACSDPDDIMFRSTDDGESWTSISSGLPQYQRYTDIAIDSSGRLFTSGSKGIYRSLDEGNTWTLYGTGVPDSEVFRICISSDGKMFGGSLVHGVFRSTDSGASWESFYKGLSNRVVLSIAIDSSGTLFAGTGSGMYKSLDNGENWLYVDFQGEIITNVVAPTAQDLVATALIYPPAIYHSKDQGLSWSGVTPSSFSFDDDVGALVVGPGGIVVVSTGAGTFLSTDYGVTWNYQSIGEWYGMQFCPNGSLLGYDGSPGDPSLNSTYRSTDQGKSWQMIDTIYPPPTGLIFAVNDNGELFSEESIPPQSWPDLYRSSDNGSTWNIINEGAGLHLPNVVPFMLFDRSGTAFAIDSGVDRSFDDCVTWERLSSGLTTDSCSVLALKNDGTLFLWTDRGFFRSTGSSLNVPEGKAGIPMQCSLAQNSPDPFTQSTTISFTLPEPSFITLTLYDATGREVAALASGFMDAGEHDVPFQRGDLPSGVYFYRLESGSSSQTRAMVILP